MQHFVSLMVLATLLLASCAKPIADFTYTGQDAPVPCTVQFANQSRHADTWFWEFGNGETSSEASPSCTYTLSGNYTITLTASKGDNAHRMEKTIQITAPEPCLVEIQTPYGNMLAQLSNETPLHRDNFMHLVEQQFYDSLLFHRVIRNFMIQGGDPNSKGAGPDARLGSGGPGYQIDAEFRDDMVHTKGAIAAARTGDQVNPQKKSSGSQFYIVQGNRVSDSILDQIEAKKGFRYTSEQREAYKRLGGTPHLDRDYTVFGHIIEGLEVIDKIAAARTRPGDRPEEDVWMIMRVVK
ncbi:MAG: peptidylprolyl isomerase [Lewinellaceae bacterium]|nr:peptidylprolyl isomerase [Saprospiraceae bacterium]MCB9312022.1 peptidylprolyl isomerase [Lewinellaceae bacterium]HRW76934.1 peptidylprolyl isomerase [Saprospiraceae bacterium]